MIYKWKMHGLGNVKAQAVGNEIEFLIKQNGGTIIPSTIVKAAQNNVSPLHPCFEWDDRKAAIAYREEQAQYILRQIVIVENEDSDDPVIVRAFAHITTDDNEGYYTTIKHATEEPELYENILEQAIAELKAAKEKYKTLDKLKDVWDAISKLP